MLKEKNNSQSLEGGAVILLLSTVLVKLIGALFKIPLSSEACLGDLGFGYFSSVYDIFNPVYTLAITGLPVAVSHIVADFTAQNASKEVKLTVALAKKLFLKLGIAAAVILALLIMPFVALTDKTGQTAYGLVAMLPSVVFCALVSVYRGYYEGLCNMLPAAISNIIEALCKLILGFGFAVITVNLTQNPALGAAAAMLGISIGTLVSALYLHIKFKREGNNTLKSGFDAEFQKKLTRLIFAFALPVAVSSLAGSMVSVIDTLTVRAQLSSAVFKHYGVLENMYFDVIGEYNSTHAAVLSKEALPTFLYGIRSKAYTLYNLVPTLTTAIGISAVPVVTEAFSKKDIKALKKNIIKVMKLSAFIALPAGIGLTALSRRIMTLLYGEGASSALGGKMLFIYGIAAIFSSLTVVLCCVLQAIKRQNISLINILIGIAVKLGLNLLLSSVPKLNIFGAVLSTLICYAVIFLLNLITLLKAVGKIKGITVIFLKLFAAAFLCGVTAYFAALISSSRLVSVVAILAGGAVYLICLLFFKCFSEEDLSAIPFGNFVVKALKKLKISL